VVEDVLDFWFRPSRRPLWFAQDADFDAEIRSRFSGLLDEALEGRHDAWAASARGRLALILVLDQFPRNLYRHTAQAFSGDERARRLVLEGLDAGHDRGLSVDERSFFYLPLEHAEDRELQALSVKLYEALGHETYLDYARRHRAIIDRFGRFPHRNEALGRPSTAEEADFLTQPESSFW
jgi:uncharacterized protein (DUF924 family)